MILGSGSRAAPGRHKACPYRTFAGEVQGGLRGAETAVGEETPLGPPETGTGAGRGLVATFGIGEFASIFGCTLRGRYFPDSLCGIIGFAGIWWEIGGTDRGSWSKLICRGSCFEGICHSGR